jgi:DNA-binding XRE family transcriptional regulator
MWRQKNMKLIEYLDQEKITQCEFAKHLGCTKNTIYRISGGIHYPSPRLAKMIIEFTDGAVTLDDLYSDRPRKTECPYCGHKLGKRSKINKDSGHKK